MGWARGDIGIWELAHQGRPDTLDQINSTSLVGHQRCDPEIGERGVLSIFRSMVKPGLSKFA